MKTANKTPHLTGYHLPVSHPLIFILTPADGLSVGRSKRKTFMTLKNATLIALIGVGTSYGIRLVWSLQNRFIGTLLIQEALFNVSLLIFLFTLYRKQQ